MAAPAGVAPVRSLSIAPVKNMQTYPQLFGFEKDINRLIDSFALQAVADGCTSFATFKQLFQSANCAYLHQAYPGCEHSPEYTQLLYATALDRLANPSPTAPDASLLWRLQGESRFEYNSDAAVNAAAVKAAADREALGWQTAETRTAAAAMGRRNVTPAPPPTLQQRQLSSSAISSSDQHLQLQSAPSCMQQPQLNEQQPQEPAVLPQLPGASEVSLRRLQPQQPPQPVSTDRVQQPLLQQQQQQYLQTPSQQTVCGQPEPGQLQPHEQQLLQQPQPHDVLAAGQGLSLANAVNDMEEDDFLVDLLAILDEADVPNMPHSSTEAMMSAAAAAAVSPSSRSTSQINAQKAPVIPAAIVPLAVKAAVVFTLHCLYITQLNQPQVCVYLPLAYLKEMQQAAAEFRAAGAAAKDALLVLQSLLSEQQLIVGSFKRPRAWSVRLSDHMQPVNQLLGPGLTTVSQTLPGVTEWRAAAVAAAARIARSSVRRVNPHYRQDSQEHREALFHLKSTLTSFSNLKALQGLCDKYSDTRHAVFGPLLRLQERQQKRTAAAIPFSSQQTAAARQQEEQWQQLKMGSKSKHKAVSSTHGSLAGTSPTAIPELFDRSFGIDLRELVNGEAARTLVLLDPAYDASKLRKTRLQQQQQQQAQGQGQGAASRQERHRGTSMKRRRGPATMDAGVSSLQSQYLADMAAAGILQPTEFQRAQEQSADDIEAVKGLGVPQQLLQMQREKRQRAMQVASEWFHAQDALMAHEDDDVQDMP